MDGVLVVDKPSGMTSHDVVDFVRRRFKTKKVGHCGTLDPLATGVLVILLDKATKLSSRLSSEDKEYICTMALGVSTDTQDASGNILKSSSTDGISDDMIRQALLSFIGEQKQIPPMISAKQYQGKRLYKLARKGIEIKRTPAVIDIKDIGIINISNPQVSFRVVCSKGTYIRTLCNDIGEKLGCGAHMSGLRRIRSGSFHIKDAVKLDELNNPEAFKK